MSLLNHDKRLHFGCGLVLGGLLAFVFLMEPVIREGGTVWLVILGVALAFALIAMRQGETFWARASSIISTLHAWLSHWR